MVVAIGMQYWLFQNIANDIFLGYPPPSKVLRNPKIVQLELGVGRLPELFWARIG